MNKLIVIFCAVTAFSLSCFCQEKNVYDNELNAHIDLAKRFEKEFNYKKAILTYDSAIKIAQAEDNKLWFAHLIRMKSRSYLIANKLDSAKVYAEKAIYKSKQINNDTILGMSLLNLGSVLRKKGD